MLEGILKKIKERAINRTVKISCEIKQSSEWTIDKLMQAVIEKKKQKKREEQQRQELLKQERELRHNLEAQTVVTNLSKWLTQKASEVLKSQSNKQSKLNLMRKMQTSSRLTSLRKST